MSRYTLEVLLCAVRVGASIAHSVLLVSFLTHLVPPAV